MRAIASLTVAEFDRLVGRVETAWAVHRARQTLDGRQRQRGGGQKGTQAIAQKKLFFIFLYYKANPTQDVMGLLFGLSQSSVSQWVGQLANEPDPKEVILHGTERRLPWPVHAGRQRRYYSGRKRHHALKNAVMVAGRKVLWCSPTVPACRHNKALI